jgi:tetratricopeptide (TPR) repeat protein
VKFLPAAVAATLLAGLVLPPTILLSDCRELGVGVHADPGEALLHRIKPEFSLDASTHMPLTSLWATQTCRHSGRAAFKLSLALSLAAPALLVLVLGSLLGSPAAAALALALTLAACWNPGHILQWLYSAFVLLAAVLLAWRAQAPSLKRSLLLGLALGTGLLFRSALVLFPPLLVLYEFLFLRRGALRPYWKHAAILLLTPYLFLLPWTAMNWASHHRFIPLEDGEADCIITTGALGLERAAKGDCRDLKKDGLEKTRSSAALWALVQVLRQPLPYLKACAARLSLALRLQPHLFLGALAALWLLRRRAPLLAVGLLALYFLVIHCMLAIQSYYLIPLWPILAAMTSLIPAALRGQREPRPQSRSYRLAVRGLEFAAVFALGLSAYALAHMAAYRRQATQGKLRLEDSLERALAAAPKDPWLLGERGRRRLARGQSEAASEDFSRALRLDPRPEHHLDLARALAARGLSAPLLGLQTASFDPTPAPHAALHVLRGLVWLERREPDRAREELASARSVLAPRPTEGRAAASPLERRILAAMTPGSERRLEGIIEEELAARPAARRRALLAALLSLEPGSRMLALRLAETAAKEGDTGKALELLGQAGRDERDFEDWRRVCSLYERLGLPQEALRVLDLLAARHPGDAELRLSQAETAARLGDSTAALRALAQASALKAGGGLRLRSARLYSQLGEHDLALTLLERLSRERPREPGTWIALAEAAGRAGRPERATAALSRALTLDIAEAQDRLHMARLCSSLGLPERALELLEPLARERPEDAGIWISLAEASERLGRRAAALAALDRAQALGPGTENPGEARRRRAKLYFELGRPELALKLLEGLSRESPREPETWILLAETARRGGHRAAALTALDRAQDLAPSRPEHLLRLAALSREMGQQARARAFLDALLARTPDDPQALLEQSRQAIASGDRASALRALSRLAGLHPAGELRRDAALAYQSLREYGKALALWNDLKADGPARAPDFSDRGLCHYLDGSTSLALSDLETAIRLDPGFLPAYLTLGSIYETQGRLKEAAKLYDAALTAKPRANMEELSALLRKTRAGLP